MGQLHRLFKKEIQAFEIAKKKEIDRKVDLKIDRELTKLRRKKW